MRYNEASLERYICEHPEALHQGLQIVGRQLCLTHGRLDILGWLDVEDVYCGRFCEAWVIELKARALKERDIGQVLRYAHDVSKAIQLADFDMAPPFSRGASDSWTEDERLYMEVRHRLIWSDSLDENIVTPRLIGTSVDDNVLSAAWSARVSVSTYSWRSDGPPIFKSACFPRNSCDDIPAWAYSTIPKIDQAAKYSTVRQIERAANCECKQAAATLGKGS